MSQETTFSNMGKSFQEKIYQGLLTDHAWAQQMIEVMDPTYFDLRYVSYLCDRYFAYFAKYKCFPTLSLLITIIKDELNTSNDVVLREQVVEYLHRMKSNPHPGDLQYVKDKSLDFCKKQAFKAALEKSVDLISTENFDSVLEIMKKAVSVGMPHSTGHDFFEDVEARFVKMNRHVCPTGIPKLDSKEILQGGLARGQLGIVIGATGCGKCCDGDTYITVAYDTVTIDGIVYKPWDKIITGRGIIYAAHIRETDTIM